MDTEQKKFLDHAAQIIYDKKGFNILALDVRDLSTITDYLLIAEGNVDRHVIAIAKTLIEELRKKNQKPLYAEGLADGDWIVLDYGRVMIHLFMPGLREAYALEKLWKEGQIIDLSIDTSKESEAEDTWNYSSLPARERR